MSEQPKVLSELKQLIADYLDARLSLFKLEAYEKISKITAVLFSSLVVALLAFFLLFFLSMSAGFYFGNLFDSNALGFLLVTGVYVILFVIILMRRKDFFEKNIIERILGILLRKEGEDE
jgi:hypothetical protein